MATDLFDKGLEVRRAVLGKEYVDKSISDADDFSGDELRLLVVECTAGQIESRRRKRVYREADSCGHADHEQQRNRCIRGDQTSRRLACTVLRVKKIHLKIR